MLWNESMAEFFFFFFLEYLRPHQMDPEDLLDPVDQVDPEDGDTETQGLIAQGLETITSSVEGFNQWNQLHNKPVPLPGFY